MSWCGTEDLTMLAFARIVRSCHVTRKSTTDTQVRYGTERVKD